MGSAWWILFLATATFSAVVVGTGCATAPAVPDLNTVVDVPYGVPPARVVRDGATTGIVLPPRR